MQNCNKHTVAKCFNVRYVDLRTAGAIAQPPGESEDEQEVKSVIMKLLNFGCKRYSYVCPGQVLDAEKFHSPDIKFAYCLIKVRTLLIISLLS